ncbi:hypothetical protein VQH23_18430 [Pararoseomonas sp. SCSIO 73927]|uniref:hypothetical protein n=1 Tax=Pararoseomonas sp. SCSIO 73927 TaxID=3114537 RepID=UPI0030D4962E
MTGMVIEDWYERRGVPEELAWRTAPTEAAIVRDTSAEVPRGAARDGTGRERREARLRFRGTPRGMRVSVMAARPGAA